MAITKAEFLSRKPKISIFTDKDGTQVNVRSLNELERTEYQSQFIGADLEIDKESTKLSKRLLIQMSVVDDSGNLMFSRSELDLIAELDSAFAERLFDYIRSVNELDTNDGVKEARKN